jgi:hypothetical protein
LFALYPNPAGDLLNIALKYPVDLSKPAMIQIYHVTHRLVYSLSVERANEFVTLNTSQWQSGLYLFEIIWPDGKQSTGKFDVAH